MKKSMLFYSNGTYNIFLLQIVTCINGYFVVF